MELSLENYDPLPEDIKDGTNRKIYSNCLLDPEEEAAIQAFQEYTEKNQIEVPIWLYDDRRIALKLMNCVKKDLKKAVSAVQMYLEWASVPPELDDFVLQYLVKNI